ncbi:helix-turn-helix domain-containing protein [Rhizorhabdus sp. FW153]|uniref:helix-turn-helix domain-containing protein n=1 Tax=Rhizorhabdus sp. FW153 TaxID=3400216 RepID=UPI003CF29C0D
MPLPNRSSSKAMGARYSHLNYRERIAIDQGIRHGVSCRELGRRLGRHRPS